MPRYGTYLQPGIGCPRRSRRRVSAASRTRYLKRVLDAPPAAFPFPAAFARLSTSDPGYVEDMSSAQTPWPEHSLSDALEITAPSGAPGSSDRCCIGTRHMGRSISRVRCVPVRILGRGPGSRSGWSTMHYCQSCPDLTPMEPAQASAVCPGCGRRDPAPTEPLLVVTGASGAGKTTLFSPLARELAGEAAVFDIDWLIDAFGMQAEGAALNWGAIRSAWLSVAEGWRLVVCRRCCWVRLHPSTSSSSRRRDGSPRCTSSSWTAPTSCGGSALRPGLHGGDAIASGRSQSRRSGESGSASTLAKVSIQARRRSRRP
jgi:hypothetical protein